MFFVWKCCLRILVVDIKIIISPLVSSGHPDKCSYEIDDSLTDLLTVHSLDPLIESSCAKEADFRFQSEVILGI